MLEYIFFSLMKIRLQYGYAQKESAMISVIFMQIPILTWAVLIDKLISGVLKRVPVLSLGYDWFLIGLLLIASFIVHYRLLIADGRDASIIRRFEAKSVRFVTQRIAIFLYLFVLPITALALLAMT